MPARGGVANGDVYGWRRWRPAQLKGGAAARKHEALRRRIVIGADADLLPTSIITPCGMSKAQAATAGMAGVKIIKSRLVNAGRCAV